MIETFVEGRAFTEGLRWHEGHLWFSDMHDHTVFRADPSGKLEEMCTVAGLPSGLGWLPDGDLLIVSMMDRKVLRRGAGGEVALHADLSALAPRRTNDMVVDARGRAYVGNFGFDFDKGEAVTGTVLLRVDPDGSVRKAADDLIFPNGMAITDNGRTLIVAETFGARLSAFDIADDGSLANRRIFAQFTDGSVPDGIAADAEGGVWAASPTTSACIRIASDGTITNRIETGRQAIACALGGDDGRTLFMSVADSTKHDACRASMNAAIVSCAVSIPGIGWT